jgi:signal transduction histidine kinase
MQPTVTRCVEDAAQPLYQQLPHLARLAAAGGEGLVITDPQGRCVFMNDLAATLGGAAAAEFHTLPVGLYLARLLKISRLVDENWPVSSERFDLAALAARPPLRFACLAEEKGLSEQEQHYALTFYPLSDDAGSLVGYALFLRDMTPMMKDGPLENGLLSSVSHDLRTPLTAIKAAVTGLLQDELVWDEALRRETLQDINEETDRLAMLVSALLEMSRIQGGALRLQTEWCDLAEIMHTVLDRLQKMTCYHQVTFDLRGPLPLVQADFMQLDRVLSNLVENAVKYSAEGTEICLAAEPREREVWIRVLDRGCGIPQEERERIFEKFYRVKPRRGCSLSDGADTSVMEERALERHMPSLAGGSGLGLAICRGIVQAHGGRIWVEPRPGGGSCFVFTLPIEQTASVGDKHPPEPGKDSQEIDHAH